MHRAFQNIDLDRSGSISVDEIVRAFQMWNVRLCLCLALSYL